MVVVVAAAVEGGITLGRVRLLGEMLGQAVDRRTLERWVKWWREELPQSPSWKGLRGRLGTAVEKARMPLSLLEAFVGMGAQERLVGVLRLLAPLASGHGI
ncbi:MAG: hypothetical protein PHQ60_16680 [Sideroxydans sp.]|nr:hypothetical protein [Sideroxydans sp.]